MNSTRPLSALLTLAVALAAVGAIAALGRAEPPVAARADRSAHPARPNPAVGLRPVATDSAQLHGVVTGGTRAFHYRLPDVSAPLDFVVAFPDLPPGTYLATYNVAARMDTPGANLSCQMVRVRSPRQLLSHGTSYLGVSVVSAAGVVDTSRKDASLWCRTSGGVSTTRPGNTLSTFDFVRLDRTTRHKASALLVVE